MGAPGPGWHSRRAGRTTAGVPPDVSRGGRPGPGRLAREIPSRAPGTFVQPRNKVWMLAGTSTVTAGNTVRVGPTPGGVTVGTAVVDTTGAWSVRVPKTDVVPGTQPTVGVESTRGGVLPAVPVEVN